jgi:hypothetical protein
LALDIDGKRTGETLTEHPVRRHLLEPQDCAVRAERFHYERAAFVERAVARLSGPLAIPAGRFRPPVRACAGRPPAKGRAWSKRPVFGRKPLLICQLTPNLR